MLQIDFFYTNFFIVFFEVMNTSHKNDRAPTNNKKKQQAHKNPSSPKTQTNEDNWLNPNKVVVNIPPVSRSSSYAYPSPLSAKSLYLLH